MQEISQNKCENMCENKCFKKKHEIMPSHDVRRNVTVHVRICAVICVFLQDYMSG